MWAPRHWRFVASLVAVSVVIAACGAPQTPPPAPSAAPGKAAEPPKVAATAAPAKPVAPAAAPSAPVSPAAPTGNIVIASSWDLTTLDANNISFTAEMAMLGNSLYETLIRLQEDGTFTGVLAESWSALSSTEWEFKLRKGAKFHTGEPFNAQVVRFNVERYKEPNKGRWSRIASVLSSATVVDDSTVRITTPMPNPLFLDSVRNMYIAPMKYTQEVGDQGLASKPVGTGPFKFVQWVKGDRFAMEAFPDYWGGTPKVKTVTFRMIPEIATRIAALKAGEADLITQLTPDQIPSLKQSPNLDVLSVSSPRVVQIGFNADDPKGVPLKDARVRQALHYAINVQAIIDTIIGGQAKRVATLAPVEAFGYDPSVQPYPYDPAKARQLLADAGHPNGFELDFAVPTGGQVLKPLEVAQAVVADWAKVGVRARIRSLETGAFTKERDEHKISAIFMWNWIAFDVDRMTWNNMHSKSPFVYNPLPDKRLDALIDEEQSTMDQAKRKEILSKLQHIMRDEATTIILYQQNDVYGMNRRLKDLRILPTAELLFAKARVEGP